MYGIERDNSSVFTFSHYVYAAMLCYPYGKSIMVLPCIHTLQIFEHSKHPILRNILGILFVAEETATYREHHIS